MRAMPWKPHVTVAAIVEQDGRFLMVEENVRGKVLINQPAGHLEEDESLVDAAIRETAEETGWRVRPTGLVGIYQWHDPDLEDSVMRVCFAAEARHRIEGATLDDGILRPLWMTADEVQRLNGRLRSPLVLESLRDYLAGNRTDLDVLRFI